MSARPWLKWYPGDWRADPLLRSCEPVSRYVWMEMIGLMHEAEPYGHLVLAGRAMDYKTLSRVIGVDEGDVKRAVKELESRAVFSRTDSGVIFSRRMIRDEKRRETLSENGGKGGNPSLKKQALSGGLDKQQVNQEDKPQIPEARVFSARGRATTLADDWQPKPFGVGTKSLEITASWSGSEFARQLEAFKAHHIGRGSKWSDWQQAWSTWVLNSVNFTRKGEVSGGDFLDHYLRQNGKAA